MRDLQDYNYTPVVERVAKYIEKNPVLVDSLGNQHCDYVSELHLRALESRLNFRQRFGGCRKQEAKYVYKSLWNYARSVKCDRAVLSQYVFLPLNRDDDSYDFEKQMEARNAVRVLQEKLPYTDWKILERIARLEGRVASAWNGQCNQLYFHSKVKKLREYAKKILEKSDF